MYGGNHGILYHGKNHGNCRWADWRGFEINCVESPAHFFCDIHSYQCRLFQNVHLLRLEMSAATARTKCYTIEQQVSWAVMQHHMNASTRDQQKREGGRVRQQTPPTPLILIYKLIFHISLQNTINVIDIDLVERGCSLSSVYICATDMIYLDTHFCCIATAHHCEKVWVCVCVMWVN